MALCFIYVRRLVSEKGLHLLIEAAESCAIEVFDFRVTVVDDEPEGSGLGTAVTRWRFQEREHLPVPSTGRDNGSAAIE